MQEVDVGIGKEAFGIYGMKWTPADKDTQGVGWCDEAVPGSK